MLLKINNYTHYYSYRTDSRGGGVSAYVHNDLKHNLSMAVYAGGNNYLWIHHERYDLEVGVVYNPGDTNFQEFLQTYEDQLQQRKRAIVFGDFNIDLLTKDRQTRTYNQLLREAGHTIINKLNKKHCTRESKTRKSILDHVSSNLKNDNFHMALIDSSMSDHKQIFVELKKSKPPCKIRTQYEAIDYPNLQSLLKKSNLEEVGDDYHLLENEVKHAIAKSRTIKTKILNPPQNDWINKDIIENINQRNELWMKFKKHPDDNNVEAKYIEKRQEVHKQIQNTKKSYYNKKFNSCMDKPKRMWNLVNMLANNKVKQSSAPSKLLIDTKYVTDTKQISEIFNSYFVTIGSLLANEIPKNFHDNPSYALPNTLSNDAPVLATLDPCSEAEISKIIANLDPNCSTGLDGISTKAIKSVKDVIAAPLCKCFNKFLTIGNFPDSLKIAKVTPIYKSGATTDPGNYRPISVLPVLSKILERILYTRLEKHLTSINFLSDRQYGFRSKSSTLSATVDLVSKKNIA